MTAALTLGRIALLAAAGAAFGRIYFALLGRSVALYITTGSAARAAPRSIARVVAAAAFFALAARLGAPELLAAFLGFLIARARAVRDARRLA